ncbi:expressed protein [Phakopsora pachyrhizi]|uniref:Expressed protein n=1 Tax=Phakopsora pachyrhizi TaxID=170000 RepID=A0AAV0B5Q4_PHAPC|nr:expressed protein [Phakopsora pachyrhizi]
MVIQQNNAKRNPKANVGEVEGIHGSVAFLGVATTKQENNIGLVGQIYMNEIEDNNIIFFELDKESRNMTENHNGIATELEIFGNLGELETKTYEGNVICAMTGTVVGATALAEEVNSFLLDSRALDHIFTERNKFYNYQPIEGKVEIGEVGRSVDIVGKGDVTLYSNNLAVHFRNAYHVPKGADRGIPSPFFAYRSPYPISPIGFCK